MSAFGRAPLVAAYVCPRGVAVMVCRRTASGVEVDRVLEVPATVEIERAAADHLVSVLRSAGIDRATVCVALRGFGTVHHVLQLPPAKDDILAPIIAREMRRLEPELGEAAIGWTPLPPLESGAEGGGLRSVLAVAAPRSVVGEFERVVRGAGYRLEHVTALPAAMQRLVEEFDDEGGSVAVVAPLMDGAFMGFVIGGAIRIAVEPPLPADAEHESVAIAEELELGAMFVRQQFRGAQLDRIAVVGARDELSDIETALSGRLQLPTRQIGPRGLSPSALAGLAAVLDSQAHRPVSIGGDSYARVAAAAASVVRTASIAAVIAIVAVGAWAITETVRAERAEGAVRTTRLRVQQDSFGLSPMRATADQRRLVRDAMSAARVVARDRVALQETLAGIASSFSAPVHLDSLFLERAGNGWRAMLTGSVEGSSSARAVQSAYDAYQQLPQRISVDSLRLVHLGYTDTAAVAGPSQVRFQFSFGVPGRRN